MEMSKDHQMRTGTTYSACARAGRFQVCSGVGKGSWSWADRKGASNGVGLGKIFGFFWLVLSWKPGRNQ